jgi:hypothetical protein
MHNYSSVQKLERFVRRHIDPRKKAMYQVYLGSGRFSRRVQFQRCRILLAGFIEASLFVKMDTSLVMHESRVSGSLAPLLEAGPEQKSQTSLQAESRLVHRADPPEDDEDFERQDSLSPQPPGGSLLQE